MGGANRAQPNALAWAAAVAGIEWATRRAFRRRSTALLAAYAALGSAAVAAGARINRGSPGDDRRRTVVGSVLGMAGYPVGCAVFRYRPDGAPPEHWSREAIAIAGVVAPAEELVWGRLVEPELGIAGTATLFAVKHPLVDGRWRRAFGLGLTWYGLGLVRKASPATALAIHVGCNASGALVGRIIGENQF